MDKANIDIICSCLDFLRPLAADPGNAEVLAMILPDALNPQALGQMSQQPKGCLARLGQAALATTNAGGQ